MSFGPLIRPEWTFALWAVLSLLAALGFWAERTRLGRHVSGAALLLVGGIALSNFGVLPRGAAAYDAVWSYLVPLAIPLLLLKADLRRVISETRSMFAAFVFGATGTLIGALLGLWLLPLGESAAKLAGAFSATYIGGSMNLVAVSQAVEIEPALVSAAVAADSVVGVMYLALLALVPSLASFGRWFAFDVAARPVAAGPAQQPTEMRAALDLAHVAVALGLAFLVCAAGGALASAVGLQSYTILFVTALTVALANLFPRQLGAIQGDREIGMLFMYVLFAAIGISADVGAMLGQALMVAGFAALILVCHALLLFLLSRLMRIGLLEAVTASSACAGGPATAAALAASRGRPDLVAPGVLLGVFGYVIANFIGVAIARLPIQP
jgi:uncharacterized membrane protein